MFSKLSKILILCLVIRVSYALSRTSGNVAFVIDDTSSMSQEINGVKEKVEQLFKAILDSKNSKIGDIILVTFNDNEKLNKTTNKFYSYTTIDRVIKVRARTRDQNTFLNELSKIKVDGGGRCPEPAMAGIKRAVEECNPNSYIYIFTDATAKDYYLSDQVVAMAQNKSVQITFLLTGNCNENLTSKKYTVYNKLANATNGEVFNIMKDDVTKIINYIIRCIESPTSIVLNTAVKPGLNKFSIKVDGDMSNIMFSVSVIKNKEVTVSLNGPDGNNVNVAYVFNEPNTKIIEVQNPNIGNYELSIYTNSQGVAIAKASIGIDFVHGFNETQVSTIEDTCTRPFAGLKSFLYIALEDNGDKKVRLEKVLIYDMNDKELNSLPVSLINNQENLYATPPFQPPDDTFKITIVALNGKHDEIRRNSRTPITPQTLPSGFPVIEKLKAKVAAEEGSKTSISCRILKGSPTPTITWGFRRYDATDYVPLSKTKDVIDMSSVELSNAGFYRCYAKNTVGETFHEIELEVQRIPKIDKSNSNVIVKEGETATVSCRIIQGIPKPQIFWQFKGKATGDFSTTSLKGQEIQIYSANLDNAGVYRCRAENVIGSDVHETTMTVQCLPKIDKSESKIAIKEGEKAVISCRIIRGIPKPEIRWEFKRNEASDFLRIASTDKELVIDSANVDNAGYYKCFAKNDIGEDVHDTELIVQYVPQIDKSKSNINVQEGDIATIPCRIIHGIPEPEVFWEFKGKDMSHFARISEKGQEIHIGPSSLDNAGVYRCSARNLIGNDVHEITLMVQSLPKIDKSEIKRTAKKGERAQISCRITQGIPKPDIRWEFKRKDASDFFSLPGTDQEFVINSAVVDNAGHYRCFAKNEIGEDVHDTELIIQYVPQIEKIKSNIKVKEGDAATIPCRITGGIPEPEIYWEFKGNYMIDFASITEKGQEIHIDRSNLDDAGVYRCTARNFIGDDVHEITLTVQCLPIIDKRKTKTTAKKGEKAVISCRITQGVPKPDILWEFKRKDASDFFSIPGTDQEFVIDSADVDNAGHYRCNAKNEIGVDIHDTELFVQYGPKIDKTIQTIQTVQEGSEATLTCRIVQSFPEAWITWEFKRKNDLKFISIYETGEKLHIKTAVLQNSGTYKCTAKNLVGKDVHEIELQVQCVPQIEMSPPSTTVTQKSKAVVPCRIKKGVPEPTISWEFKRKGTMNFVSISGTSQEILINSADSQNAGIYRCHATNPLGRDSHDTELIVQYPPLIRKGKQPKTVVIGEKAVLSCRIRSAFPDPEIAWKFKKRFTTTYIDLAETQQDIYVDTKDVDNSGYYKCVAKNNVGEDFYEIELVIEYAPSVDVKQPDDVVKVGDAVILSCNADGLPEPHVRWLRNNLIITKNHKYTIDDTHNLSFVADLNDRGNFTCEAKNKHGIDTVNATLEVYEPVTIEFVNNDLNVDVGSDLDLVCDARGYPPPKIMWKLSSFVSMSLVDLPSTDKTLNIKRIQISDSGNYFCIANNQYSQNTFSYEVNVNVPVEIHETQKEFYFVEHDSILRVPCKATGNPEPAIIWEKDGNTLKIDNTSYAQDNYGTLLIFSPTESSEGQYSCNAYQMHRKSKAVKTFTVKRKPIRSHDEEVDTELVEENTSYKIQCKVPHGPTDVIQWYKDAAETIRGVQSQLKLHKVSERDAGIYTCRVNTALGSKSAHIQIVVGAKPVFIHPRKKDVIIIPFVYKQKINLDCDANGKPPPEVKWYHENQLFPETTSILTFKERESHKGTWRCEVKNKFGTITRTYEIKLTGCVIDYNILDPKKHHPLIVHGKISLNAFENQDGRLTVPQNEHIQIVCPNSQNFYCYCEDNEFIDDSKSQHHNYTDLKCDIHMKPQARILSLPGKRCAVDKDSKLIQVGFEVGSSFSVVYDVCFDSQKKFPKFIYNTLNRFASGVDLDTQRKPQFRSDFFKDSLDVFYEESQCYNQANTYGFGCCFVRKQFVTPRDVPPAVENATYFSVNVMPQWNFCGKDNNWDEVERRIRKLAKTVEFTLKIYSGGFLYEPQIIRDVYGGTGYNVNLVVPKYLWKVVQIDELSQALAIIIINIPKVSEVEESLVFCKDVCHFTDWMQNNDWHNVENGYVFCCSATDFADTVDKYYKNIFYSNILRTDQIT